MNNVISFDGAELASLEIRTAKNGNAYATGILILRDENGKYEASLPFLSFAAADSLASITRSETNPDASGGDLHFDGEDASTRERTAAKAASRPKANVQGWLRTSKNKQDKWSTVFMLEALSI